MVSVLLDRRIHAPLTSSMGRLFDAVAALAGLCDCASFEGQAAVRLEALAATCSARDGYPFGIDASGMLLEAAPVIHAVIEDERRGVGPAVIARRFHTGLAKAVAAMCAAIRERADVGTAALSGGVFSNAILTSDCQRELGAVGFRVICHRDAPPNDGGLEAFGQMAIAAAQDASEDRE